jgi:Tfp pilus assembly protein PilF
VKGLPDVCRQPSARNPDLIHATQSLARFPDVHDGYDRLGMVCEARGDRRQAADYYRRAINVIRNHPDNYDPAFEGLPKAHRPARAGRKLGGSAPKTPRDI